MTNLMRLVPTMYAGENLKSRYLLADSMYRALYTMDVDENHLSP